MIFWTCLKNFLSNVETNLNVSPSFVHFRTLHISIITDTNSRMYVRPTSSQNTVEKNTTTAILNASSSQIYIDFVKNDYRFSIIKKSLFSIIENNLFDHNILKDDDVGRLKYCSRFSGVRELSFRGWGGRFFDGEGWIVGTEDNRNKTNT